MSRRRLALLIAVIAAGLLWRPILYPAGKAALLLLDIYSPVLLGTNVTALVTPEPREEETRATYGGVEMRVSSWRPGWGDRHPGLMIVNGATPLGNDNAATRQFARSLARAGYLVVLPEFPFLKEGRLDVEAPRVADAAFAALRASPLTEGRPAGAFGASVGAGVMLVAAGTEPALARADHLTILGGYYDIDTYVAAVAARQQRLDGALVAWQPSAEVLERLPPAVVAAMPDDADRAAMRAALEAGSYDAVLSTLRQIPPRGRAVLDRLSPSTVWPRIAPPVFWIHDPNDDFEPLAEARMAEAAERSGRLVLVVPRLVQHAEVGASARGRDVFFLAGELWGLLTFTLDVLRIAG